jgi:hypothetical protein
VVVIGGGIAGLTAAHAVRRDAAPGTRVTLVEASGRLGGKLRTEEFAGRPVDSGADAFLARVPAGVHLARELGLATELVSPATRVGVRPGRRPAAPHPQGHGARRPRPVGPARSLSGADAGCAARAAAEPLLPGRPLSGDVSVGELVGRRFGRQVVDRLVDPLLGGVYAGSAAGSACPRPRPRSPQRRGQGEASAAACGLRDRSLRRTGRAGLPLVRHRHRPTGYGARAVAVGAATCASGPAPPGSPGPRPAGG